jgi:hypothetical protein
VRLVAEHWKVADDQTREKYREMAKTDFQRYTEEMEAYKARPEVQGALEEASMVGAKKKFVGVNKRPLSGYVMYIQEEHARLKAERQGRGLSVLNLTGEIARRWSSLDPTSKAAYNLRAQRHKELLDSAYEVRVLSVVRPENLF